MTSKDEEIQELYNIINSFSILDQTLCKCVTSGGSCDICYIQIADARETHGLCTRTEFDFLLKEHIGIKVDLLTDPFKYNDPIKYASDINNIYGKHDYQLIFIEHGIRLTMTVDFVKKISILNSILLEENGADKAFQTRYLSSNLKPINGPKIYITKLPLESLIFNKPPSEDHYDVTYHRTSESRSIQDSGWFKYKNIAEILWNLRYYV
jgi:hypothetical protein